ncbi:MAG: hypothetical protein ACRD30_01475 [Bryobacteraceae bacterium]
MELTTRELFIGVVDFGAKRQLLAKVCGIGVTESLHSPMQFFLNRHDLIINRGR